MYRFEPPKDRGFRTLVGMTKGTNVEWAGTPRSQKRDLGHPLKVWRLRFDFRHAVSEGNYSDRSVWTGSMAAARRGGSHVPAIASSDRRSTTASKASGS
jgi:hypothetical protein